MRLPLGLSIGCLLLASCGGSAHHTVPHPTPPQCPPLSAPGPHYAPCGPHARGFAVPPKTGKLSALPPVRGVATREMFDSIIVSTVPSNPWAVAGYTSGFWPTYNPLVAAFPAAHHLSIAVSAGHAADCLDDEPGDATPAQAGPWARWMLSLHHKLICIYGSLSAIPALKASVRAAGVSARVLWWCAWYRYFPGLVSGCDAVQWTDHALSRNLDQSTVDANFFGPPTPPPVDPYAKYPDFVLSFREGNGIVHARERNTVKTYDTAHCTPRDNRFVCFTSRDHLVLLLGRINFLRYHVRHGNRWVAILRPRDSSDQLGSRAAGIRGRLG